MYQKNDYDLAGFAVGIVEKNKLINGQQVQIGDVILGLGASGPHSNGYSLIRKIVSQEGDCFNKVLDDAHYATLGDILLTPTQIYVNTVLTLLKTINPHAIAHITGGGLIENIPRVLPDFTQAVINVQAWERPLIFKWLQAKGKITDDEMFRTFNCGIGLILCIPENEVKQAIELLTELDELVWQIGVVAESQQKEPVVKFINDK
jgi:phosphoribosylformylglycinamidine cyclo-ligase